MPQTSIFGNDRPLLYDVHPWNELGFAVPNFGDNVGTLATPIWNLAHEIGQIQLFIMTHVDAMRTQPPSINTIIRIGKMCNRAFSVLNGRSKAFNELRLEEAHASADLKPWQVHPVPYFNSAILKNGWLAEYNRLVMIALTNMYQHSDNNLALTVTAQFASDVYIYFKEIKRLMGTELLLLDEATVEPDTFLFDESHYQAYDPSRVTLNLEGLSTPGPIQSRATEDDLRPLFDGFPATLIVNNLKQYAVEGMLGLQGAPLPGPAVAPGSQNTAPPGGGIGQPQI